MIKDSGKHAFYRAVLPSSLERQHPVGTRLTLAASKVGGFVDLARAASGPWELALRSSSVAPGFDRHCISEFEHLAMTSPTVLIDLARSEFRNDDVLLAQAAEALAHSASGSDVVVPFLLNLLSHPREFVREGAIYGLAAWVESAGVRTAIEKTSKSDSSPGVRGAAADVLSLL